MLMGEDLAEQALEGLVRAPRYAALEISHATAPVSDITARDGRPASQLLHGEIFEILFRRAGRAYGRARRDGAVGWVSEDVLKKGLPRPAYRVAVRGGALPFNALVSGSEEGLEPAALVEVARFENDPVVVARNFIGAQVAAGARSDAVDGIGLVQQVLFACGRAAPRRAADLAVCGRTVDRAEVAPGDVVVWVSQDDTSVGHAAVVVADGRIIHACKESGQVIEDDLDRVSARLAGKGLGEPVFGRHSV